MLIIRRALIIKDRTAVFAGWNQIRIADFFKQLLEVDVFVENDVNACAIAELQFGYKSRYQNFLWMTISTGVGGAVVCNGRLIRGVDGYAGEIGHVKVEFEHPYPCPCSELGCLEAHGSGTAINRYVRELCLTDPDFLAELQTNGYSSDAVGCAALALQGNSAAQSVFNKAGTYLGKGISHYVNILNPEAIILGGGVARSFSLLEKPIRDTMKQTVFRPLKHVDVVTTKLGYEAAFLGAAALVLS